MYATFPRERERGRDIPSRGGGGGGGEIDRNAISALLSPAAMAVVYGSELAIDQGEYFRRAALDSTTSRGRRWGGCARIDFAQRGR